MIFTDYYYLFSDDPTGKELKLIAKKITLNFSWYYHYQEEGITRRYFTLTRAKFRLLRGHMAGNTHSRKTPKVYLVSKESCTNYLKTGEIPKVDIYFNTDKFFKNKPYRKIFNIVFKCPATGTMEVEKEGETTKITLTTIKSNYHIEVSEKGYGVYRKGKKVEIPRLLSNHLNNYYENRL